MGHRKTEGPSSTCPEPKTISHSTKTTHNQSRTTHNQPRTTHNQPRTTQNHPLTTAWILKMSQANEHLWPLSMVQIKAFLLISTFLVGKFWGYSHIKLTNFETCLWTFNMCHMGPEHT